MLTCTHLQVLWHHRNSVTDRWTHFSIEWGLGGSVWSGCLHVNLYKHTEFVRFFQIHVNLCNFMQIRPLASSHCDCWLRRRGKCMQIYTGGCPVHETLFRVSVIGLVYVNYANDLKWCHSLDNPKYRYSDAWESEPGCMQIQTNSERFVEIHADLH